MSELAYVRTVFFFSLLSNIRQLVMSMLDTFKNSYIIVIPVIVFGIIMAFFDSVLSGEKRKRVDYLKLIVLLSMVTIGIIYINKTKKIVSEDVISGVAPF